MSCTKSEVFLTQFATRIYQKDIPTNDGMYSYSERKWIGNTSQGGTKTKKKSVRVFSEDESEEY